MNPAALHFHFSLGPVQEFVAQARRTHDFWAGSFLLSWLSGVAMCAVRAQGGKILIPAQPDAWLDAICGKSPPPARSDGPFFHVGKEWRIGAIPNRFSAAVGPDFDASRIAATVRAAWQHLAWHCAKSDGMAWTHDASCDGPPPKTSPRAARRRRLDSPSQHIWRRQIQDFWDIQWLLLESSEEAQHEAQTWLDGRKAWRTQVLHLEDGHKCSLMPAWQELSGQREHAAVKAFWLQIREQLACGFDDIGEREQLCAPAWVKRRFVRSFASFRAEIHGLSLCGWALPPAVPSTWHLAALPWLGHLLHGLSGNAVAQKIAADFLELARAAGFGDSERHNQLRHLQEICAQATPSEKKLFSDLAALDSQAWYEDALPNHPPLQADPALLKKMETALKNLGKAVKLSPPHKYFALLIMDGDSMGEVLRDPALRAPLAAALQDFTGQVTACVDQHSGFVVYAGGDDVLALLPAERGLECSLALRRLFQQAFASGPLAGFGMSISSALSFAHVKTPLTEVCRHAHVLLDEVAKRGHGRDSLAVSVWKGSGLHLTWGMPWECALQSEDSAVQEQGRELELLQLAQSLAAGKLGTDKNVPYYSQGFFRRSMAIWQQMSSLPQQLQLQMLEYEYGHCAAAERHSLRAEQVQEVVLPVWRQARYLRRVKADGKCTYPEVGSAQVSSLLFLLFLTELALEKAGRFKPSPSTQQELAA